MTFLWWPLLLQDKKIYVFLYRHQFEIRLMIFIGQDTSITFAKWTPPAATVKTFSNLLWKTAQYAMVFCIGSMIVQPVLLYTLIWYDKFSSDQKRTFINMLNSSICWLSIEYIIIVQTTEVLRLLNIIATELQ